MGKESRTPLRDYRAQRIALIKPSALGDIVHSLPVLRALRQRYPHAYIAWVVNCSYAELLRGHPDLDLVLPFDRRAAPSPYPLPQGGGEGRVGSPYPLPQGGGEGRVRGSSKSGLLAALLNYGQFLHGVRQRHFDLVIDLQGLLRSGLMAFCSGAARRVGLSTAREGASMFYTDVIPVPDFHALHAVDRYWLIADAFGVGHLPKSFHVPIADAERHWAMAFLAGCPRPWMAMGVGSRWRTKRWPPEHFAALARRAQAYAGGTVFFVGGRDESPLAQAAAEHLTGQMRDLTGQTTLPRLAALLASVDLMVANDTGPLHMAAALGRPVVAPYTCTKVLLNGPYGAAQGAVATRVWCQGSYRKRCRRLDCMAELTPDRLWPVLEGVLRTWKSSSLSA